MARSISKKQQELAEQYVTEFIRCKNDFEYFCENYIVLELPGGDKFLTPYQEQRNYVREIENKKFVCVLKSRQIGISVITSAYACWLLIFYPNVVVGIISKDGPEATRFARRIAGFIDKLPKWMKPKGPQGGFKVRNAQSFVLYNGSECVSAAVNPNQPEKTLRGSSITFFIFDEASHVKFADKFWTSLVPALSTSQKNARLNNVPYGTVVISTPNGVVGTGGWFYKRYSRAISGQGIFHPYTIHWKDIPELANDPEWYNNQVEMFDRDPRKIAQELELTFLSSEGGFFLEDTCKKLQENRSKPIKIIKLFNGEAWVFSNPQIGKNYLIGVDTASEYGEDSSTIEVFDYETLEQVFEYQGKLRVDDFIKVVEYACARYPGVLVVENNSYGNQICEAIDRSIHESMLYRYKTGESTYVRGLPINIKTRPLVINALYDYITNFPDSIKSERLVLELIGLVLKNGKVQADEGGNDDLALALGFIYYVRKYDPPLMLDFSSYESSFNDIMLNNVQDKMLEGGVTNSSVLSYVKNNLTDLLKEKGASIDIFDLFKSEMR